MKFLPGDFELAFRSLVVESVQTNVLHENVQAVNKRPRRLDAGWIGTGAKDGRLLLFDYSVSL